MSDNDMVQVDKNEHFLPMQTREAIRALANAVNLSIFGEYVGVYGFTGTPATTPFGTSDADATNARKVLNKQVCPKENRRGVLDYDAEANALSLPSFKDVSQVGRTPRSRSKAISDASSVSIGTPTIRWLPTPQEPPQPTW
jgi:hypothetical protein